MNSSIVNLSFVFTQDSFYLDDIELQNNKQVDVWIQKFHDDRYEALYAWGIQERPKCLHPSASFLYQVSEAFFDALTSLSELAIAPLDSVVEVSDDIWEKLCRNIPFVIGSEFLDRAWVSGVFVKLQAVFAHEIAVYDGSVKLYLAEKNQNLRMPERIFFHLVEDHKGVYPFAFLATYATKDEQGVIRHLPLQYALTEFKDHRDRLLSLLACLNKVASVSALIDGFMQSGELFHPLGLSECEAYAFLKDIEAIEKCGILCRIPNWWRKKYASIQVQLQVGGKKASLLGFDSLLEVQPKLMVHGMELTEKEIQDLLLRTEGLAFMKGKWIEVNHAKLQKMLEELHSEHKSLTMMEAMRMNLHDHEEDEAYSITNGEWLASLFQKLRVPSKISEVALPQGIKATLRPYQNVGYAWLQQISEYGFGGCLADDMGLGKTVQMLTFLEHLREMDRTSKVLLIVPASLLGNWEKEAAKFTPSMDLHILHGRSKAILEAELQQERKFLTITTYGMVTRMEMLQKVTWNCIILDEAQAIKNPMTKQTKIIKKLQGKTKIALTGTPIENDLINLWSLFDFLNTGLLGSLKEFKEFVKKLNDHPQGYQKLKTMVSPFILRRLKTDKTILHDLPDKVEVNDYVNLSKQQVILYRKLVHDMQDKIINSSGIEHRGIVLSAITKLKQICNHPDQFLGEEAYAAKDSGKFEMLKEICETIYEKRERVLVFTQYKEIIPYLFTFLSHIFHKEGYIIHGGTPIKKRGVIVDHFNGEAYVPFMILSLKAAGTGLNLTSANHVIHFDRWWNPAVENQASDRAYRIGQKKNVVIHKLICNGTIEEKIDQLIVSKKALAENVIGSGGTDWIGEFSNEEIMDLLRLEER